MPSTLNEDKTGKPEYKEPIVIPYNPQIGEYVTRPIGYGSIQETPYDPWAIQSGEDTKKYGYTALHPQVAPALQLKCDGPFWTEYNFHADNDYERYPQFEEIDDRLINLIEKQTKKLSYETFTNSLKSIWRDVLIYGFSVAEYVYKFDQEFYLIDSIKTHSPFLFDLYTDQGHNLDKIYYRLTGQFINRDQLPKFIVATYPFVEHGKYYGSSALKSIYFDVQLIEILEQAQAEGVRRLAIKPLIHYFNSENMSPDELDKVKKALFAMDSGSLISFPALTDPDSQKLSYQHEIKVLEDRASADGTALIKDILDTIYRRINRCLGQPDDLGFSVTNVGSYAKSQTEMNLYTQTIVNDQNWIEDLVNRQIIPAMIQYNFPSIMNIQEYHLPVFQFGSVEEEYDMIVVQSMVDMLSAGILSIPEDLDYIRDRLSLPPASDEAKARALQTVQQQALLPSPEPAALEAFRSTRNL